MTTIRRPIGEGRLKYRVGDKVRLNRLAYKTRGTLRKRGIPEMAVLTVQGYDSNFFDKAVLLEELPGQRMHEMFLDLVSRAANPLRGRNQLRGARV